jgi:hypothetical protein
MDGVAASRGNEEQPEPPSEAEFLAELAKHS